MIVKVRLWVAESQVAEHAPHTPHAPTQFATPVHCTRIAPEVPLYWHPILPLVPNCVAMSQLVELASLHPSMQGGKPIAVQSLHKTSNK